MKVDPKNLNSPRAPLEALDQAGVYGKDIEGLYQICGRHPGRMVAVLRALPLGLIDAPAIQAALKPVGIVRTGGLDVDGIITAVETAVPEFSPSRVASPPHGDNNPVPSVPAKISSVQPPAPGHGKGGVSDS